MPQPEQEAAGDPDNLPPRSRLFLVVPKTADGQLIHVRSWRLAAAAAAAPAAGVVTRHLVSCSSSSAAMR
jgi:hypothetical protein